jgi:hypothetical protein
MPFGSLALPQGLDSSMITVEPGHSQLLLTTGLSRSQG